MRNLWRHCDVIQGMFVLFWTNGLRRVLAIHQYPTPELTVKRVRHLRLTKTLNHAHLPVANTPVFEWNSPAIGWIVFKMFNKVLIFVRFIIINFSLNSAWILQTIYRMLGLQHNVHCKRWFCRFCKMGGKFCFINKWEQKSPWFWIYFCNTL